MREILFRGKRTDNGDWFYGDLLQNVDCLKIREQEKGIKHIARSFEIIPETAGQYTGLTDKNGKKIFEGDIVRTQPFSDRPYSSRSKYRQHIGVVEYRVNHFKNSLYEQDYEASWKVDIKDYGKYGCCDWSAFFKCEVIGNIHDNPELLKGE